jgi:hypothetical protein
MVDTPISRMGAIHPLSLTFTTGLNELESVISDLASG